MANGLTGCGGMRFWNNADARQDAKIAEDAKNILGDLGALASENLHKIWIIDWVVQQNNGKKQIHAHVTGLHQG